jgi:hypothetical protein
MARANPQVIYVQGQAPAQEGYPVAQVQHSQLQLPIGPPGQKLDRVTNPISSIERKKRDFSPLPILKSKCAIFSKPCPEIPKTEFFR